MPRESMGSHENVTLGSELDVQLSAPSIYLDHIPSLRSPLPPLRRGVFPKAPTPFSTLDKVVHNGLDTMFSSPKPPLQLQLESQMPKPRGIIMPPRLTDEEYSEMMLWGANRTQRYGEYFSKIPPAIEIAKKWRSTSFHRMALEGEDLVTFVRPRVGSWMSTMDESLVPLVLRSKDVWKELNTIHKFNLTVAFLGPTVITVEELMKEGEFSWEHWGAEVALDAVRVVIAQGLVLGAVAGVTAGLAAFGVSLVAAPGFVLAFGGIAAIALVSKVYEELHLNEHLAHGLLDLSDYWGLQFADDVHMLGSNIRYNIYQGVLAHDRLTTLVADRAYTGTQEILANARMLRADALALSREGLARHDKLTTRLAEKTYQATEKAKANLRRVKSDAKDFGKTLLLEHDKLTSHLASQAYAGTEQMKADFRMLKNDINRYQEAMERSVHKGATESTETLRKGYERAIDVLYPALLALDGPIQHSRTAVTNVIHFWNIRGRKATQALRHLLQENSTTLKGHHEKGSHAGDRS